MRGQENVFTVIVRMGGSVHVILAGQGAFAINPAVVTWKVVSMETV